MFYLTTHSTHFIYGYMASAKESIPCLNVGGREHVHFEYTKHGVILV